MNENIVATLVFLFVFGFGFVMGLSFAAADHDNLKEECQQENNVYRCEIIAKPIEGDL